jgi:Fic family protein
MSLTRLYSPCYPAGPLQLPQSKRGVLVKAFTPALLPRPDLNWASLVPLIGHANRALARYDGLVQALVNPEIFLAPLGRREAVLSSRIEGTQASLREVLEFEADPREPLGARYQDILEIINYRNAMRAAVDELGVRPLSLNLLKRAHFVLLDSVRGRDKARGDFRREIVYIAPHGVPIERASYVPPAAADLPLLLDNFEQFLHLQEPDAIVQAAIVHAQFELIHPFLDGNGRVGRMLIPLFLFTKGMISAPAFYVSAYLESHRDEYYARLQGLSEANDWQRWIEFFLRTVANQAEEDTIRVKRILALYDRMKVVLAEKTRSQFAIQALDPLFTVPIFSTPQFIELSRAPRASAARMLGDLVEAGVLVVLREGRGRRAQIYCFPELLDVIETEVDTGPEVLPPARAEELTLQPADET